MKLVNLIFNILLIITFLCLNCIPIKALTVSPASGVYNAGSTVSLTIAATPQTGENALNLRLQFTGMTVQSYTSAGGWLQVTPVCSGGANHTTNTVCVDYLSSSNITSSQFVGTVTVQMGVAGTGSITCTGSKYSDGTDERTVTCSGISYSIIGTYPGTSTASNLKSFLFYSTGVIFLVVGVTLYVNKKKSPRSVFES